LVEQRGDRGGPEDGTSELEEGADVDEDEGDLVLGDEKEYVEEEDGGVDDGVVDH
jgi:hypothetical protein